MFYRHNTAFWYQFCHFKHFLKAESNEDSLASSCEEFWISFHVTQYETGLLLELGGGMIWGVRIAIFTEIRQLVGYKNLSPFCLFLDLKICAIWQLARLNKSLSVSTWMQWKGISV